MSVSEYQVGAYAVPPSEVDLFAACGFTLAMTSRPHDLAYETYPECALIDTGPLHIAREVIIEHHRAAKNTSTPIAFTAAEESKILTAIEKRVRASAQLPAVVAFYILDDYTGCAPKLYARIRDLIQAQAPGRLVIQGFGGTLDVSKDGGQSFEPCFAERQHYSNRELLNYVPGCTPLLYVYSLGKHAPVSDFSMANLMPWMLDELEGVGWLPDVDALIGGPQCWEDVPPSGEQVAQQCEAFAQHGASSICAFTWANFSDGTVELSNSPDLRAGLMAGRDRCAEVWNAAAS